MLDQLSSRTGTATHVGNNAVAACCLAEPRRLEEIVTGLTGPDPALIGDCAEVLTKVAETRPDLVAPYLDFLAGLLTHQTTRVRWETTHCLAHVATVAPNAISRLFDTFATLVRSDKPVIVRDYAIDATGGFAATSPTAAAASLPLRRDTLTRFDR